MHSRDERSAHEELQCWTLTLGDPTSIHQHVVDAWTAQHADGGGKPIALAFALAGLHLHLNLEFTGREVQRAHMAMALAPNEWPRFPIPEERGTITALDVMRAAPGPDRVKALDAWCSSVWATFRESHQAVAALVECHSGHLRGRTATPPSSRRVSS